MPFLTAEKPDVIKGLVIARANRGVDTSVTIINVRRRYIYSYLLATITLCLLSFLLYIYIYIYLPFRTRWELRCAARLKYIAPS